MPLPIVIVLLVFLVFIALIYFASFAHEVCSPVVTVLIIVSLFLVSLWTTMWTMAETKYSETVTKVHTIENNGTSYQFVSIDGNLINITKVYGSFVTTDEVIVKKELSKFGINSYSTKITPKVDEK